MRVGKGCVDDDPCFTSFGPGMYVFQEVIGGSDLFGKDELRQDDIIPVNTIDLVCGIAPGNDEIQIIEPPIEVLPICQNEGLSQGGFQMFLVPDIIECFLLNEPMEEESNAWHPC